MEDTLITDVLLPDEHTCHLLQVMLGKVLKQRDGLKELLTFVLFSFGDISVDFLEVISRDIGQMSILSAPD